MGGGLIFRGVYERNLINVLERPDKTDLRNKLKQTYHYISIYNFIIMNFFVCNNKWRIYFKDIYIREGGRGGLKTVGALT